MVIILEGHSGQIMITNEIIAILIVCKQRRGIKMGEVVYSAIKLSRDGTTFCTSNPKTYIL